MFAIFFYIPQRNQKNIMLHNKYLLKQSFCFWPDMALKKSKFVIVFTMSWHETKFQTVP